MGPTLMFLRRVGHWTSGTSLLILTTIFVYPPSGSMRIRLRGMDPAEASADDAQSNEKASMNGFLDVSNFRVDVAILLIKGALFIPFLKMPFRLSSQKPDREPCRDRFRSITHQLCSPQQQHRDDSLIGWHLARVSQDCVSCNPNFHLSVNQV